MIVGKLRRHDIIKSMNTVEGLPKLQPNVKAFANKLLDNPKISATQAYLDTHTTTNRRTANDLASKALRNPKVMIYMQKHAERAKERIVELVESKKEDIALKASFDIMDRTYGKAIQRQESNNTNVNLNVEASQELSDNFLNFLKQTTQQG